MRCAGWPRSGAASLFLAELALDRAITLRQEAAQQAVPVRARRAKRRRSGFQAGIPSRCSAVWQGFAKVKTDQLTARHVACVDGGSESTDGASRLSLMSEMISDLPMELPAIALLCINITGLQC